ncbi:MAG: DUF5615 family PIN-like protein [Bryobacterales bacterium]|nr:DUF5615 family PIN-like protein [Bryobacterales bacterium]
MRLLADENVPKPVIETLRTASHDVLWARTDLAGALSSRAWSLVQLLGPSASASSR